MQQQLVERLALLERDHQTLQKTVEVQAAFINTMQHHLIGEIPLNYPYTVLHTDLLLGYPPQKMFIDEAKFCLVMEGGVCSGRK